MAMLKLITGGARSGKSSFAEKLAAEFDRVTYIATAQAFDDEMRDRIARHRARRPSHWTTVEAPFDAHQIIDRIDADCILFDCLTVYLSNFLCRSLDEDPIEYCGRLLDAMTKFNGTSLVVTNEVGSGIVPMNELARAFRDHQGLINQSFAAVADEVYLCACGLPLRLK
ncbi:MAG: bifunctional adenosylcobinamide kinase/adenosylcobinamide-phosphate guanylyltransferase [Selenomonadaceae bacterium]|nr:bifunctional adenosylcobinamide kinase/adenosylcobinamide-phosphate guanylyltransferase [Selenomonadaceae bacterium]